MKIIKWWEQYKVMLNPQKSGILRIRNRAGKTKEIKNCANIPEVKEYKYLGINKNQSLNFKELIKKTKIKSKYLKYNLRKVKNTKLTPRLRRLLLKTIYIKMVTYGRTALYRRNKQYRDWLESALFQLTKQICGERENPKRIKLFKSVDILNAEQLVNLRTNRGYSIESFENKEAILECFRSPTVINFLLRTTLSDCRWKGKDEAEE